jgi:peptidoglycan/xylan/chitin deacetylase (PgdA/CDA1 family)
MKAILTYHSIDDSGSPVSISPAVFAAHQRWLARGRVRVLPLAELVADDGAHGDAVAITFDDAFANTAAPIAALLGDGLPVTVFAVSGHVGGTNAWDGREQRGIPTLPLMGWDDLARLAARGAAIECHTRRHPVLTRVPAGRLDEELAGSADDLEKRLGVRSTHLAYPYGQVNRAVVDLASRYFRYGYTTEFRPVGPAVQPLECPRLDMYYCRTSGDIEGWGSRSFARRLEWIRFRRAVKRRFGG